MSAGIAYFNPRPPRGGRPMAYEIYRAKYEFQSTPPARGATRAIFSRKHAWLFQSTPPARGATLLDAVEAIVNRFQSTPPARGATLIEAKAMLEHGISIHAPREGGDRSAFPRPPLSGHFNPRPPRGGRQQKQPNDSTVFTKKQTIITNGVLKIRLITNMLCVLLKISFRIRCEAAALFCLLELRI